MTTARDRRQAYSGQTLDGERGALIALLVMVLLGVTAIFLVAG
ncbi:MAG TPA: hypothetical protein VF174_07745 [Micromonosporaceae bacterium]